MGKTKRVGKYELKETLGKGNFSKVKRSVNVETGLFFLIILSLFVGEIHAIKIVNISSVEKEGLEKQVKREISVLKSIKHPNVVQMIEVLKSPNHVRNMIAYFHTK
jgi:serine/threonine protein kinase